MRTQPRLAAANGVGLLVFNKLSWAEWAAWVEGDAPGFEVVHTEGNYVVVAVRGEAIER